MVDDDVGGQLDGADDAVAWVLHERPLDGRLALPGERLRGRVEEAPRLPYEAREPLFARAGVGAVESLDVLGEGGEGEEDGERGATGSPGGRRSSHEDLGLMIGSARHPGVWGWRSMRVPGPRVKPVEVQAR